MQEHLLHVAAGSCVHTRFFELSTVLNTGVRVVSDATWVYVPLAFCVPLKNLTKCVQRMLAY